MNDPIIEFAIWAYVCSVLVMLADYIVNLSRLKKEGKMLSSRLGLSFYCLLPVFNTIVSLLILADYWIKFWKYIDTYEYLHK